MPGIAGYVTDIPYVRGFKSMLAPAWLDFVALLGGVRPPARQDGFTWCDLGCGQGVSAAILAATHRCGDFHGFDAMPIHIEHAGWLARDIGASRAHFHATDFAAALELDLPDFDYIVAHGVYTWIDQGARTELRRLIDRRLKPGGLVYVSYNALPGWTGDLPFQHLVRALAADGAGDSGARFAAAARAIQRLADAGAPALANSFTVRELRDNPGNYPRGYLVHEFLHAGWQPLYVTELRRDLAEIGLRPVGSAFIVENFDRWVLTEQQRELVAAIADPDLRELARDFCIEQRFRADVFMRDAVAIDAAEQRQRLFAAGLALVRPPSAIAYRVATPASQLDYDNPVARAIVAALASGARCLADMPPCEDLLANALALCAVNDVRPVETERVPVDGVNQALRRRFGGTEPIPVVALPCGTALDLEDASIAGYIGSDAVGWRDFLATHGV